MLNISQKKKTVSKNLVPTTKSYEYSLKSDIRDDVTRRGPKMKTDESLNVKDVLYNEK